MKRARAQHEYGCEHAAECVSTKQQQNVLLRLATRALQTPVRLVFFFCLRHGADGGARDRRSVEWGAKKDRRRRVLCRCITWLGRQLVARMRPRAILGHLSSLLTPPPLFFLVLALTRLDGATTHCAGGWRRAL
jgi:hypothetical protein